MRTIFPRENDAATEPRTDSAQKTPESENGKVKFPKRIRFRGKVLAVIYGKKENYAFYRVCAYVAGKRYMASFATYSEAKAHADKLAKDLAKGSVVAALSAGQARDAVGTIITNTACFTTLEVL